MRKIILLQIFLPMIFNTVAQEKLGRPFFTGDVNFTLGLNEDFSLDSDNDETFLEPAAIFFRVGLGYEFKKRIAVSVNGGYDLHWKNDVDAFPTYGALKYNITERDNDTHFIEIRYGKMWTPSSKFPDGDYYAIGFGIQVAGEERWNTVFRIDYHQKKIAGFYKNRLESLSFGFGFTFL